jgi:flagellar protein FliS
MKPNRTELAYQEAAVRNASSIELVVMLYDILARDLHGAIEALEAGNIELRSAKLKHGFLVLQQLEGTLNMEQGGELATNRLRTQMMKGQIQQDPAVLRELMQLLFSVREAWMELNGRLATSSQAKTQTDPAASTTTLGAAGWKA